MKVANKFVLTKIFCYGYRILEMELQRTLETFRVAVNFSFSLLNMKLSHTTAVLKYTFVCLIIQGHRYVLTVCAFVASLGNRHQRHALSELQLSTHFHSTSSKPLGL
jgi:hypothetical protein